MAAQLTCCNINKPSPTPASCPHLKLFTYGANGWNAPVDSPNKKAFME